MALPCAPGFSKTSVTSVSIPLASTRDPFLLDMSDDGGRLPPEIIAKIVEVLDMNYLDRRPARVQKADLAACSLTCRYWAAKIQPQLFASLELRSAGDIQDLLGIISRKPHLGTKIDYIELAVYISTAPYIHHLERKRSDPSFSIDGFAYASECVRAAAQTVLLVEILEAHKLLNGAAWVHSFILTLAASVLTYFVLHAKSRVTIEESKLAVTKAGRMLAALGQNSVATRRVHESLSPYVDIILGQNLKQLAF